MPGSGWSPSEPALTAYRYLWQVVDWIYPPRCGGCGVLGRRWCEQCQAGVIRIGDSICPTCGLSQDHMSQCNDCQKNPPAYETVRSWGIYQGSLRQAVIQLKYKRNLGLAEMLSGHLANYLVHLNWEVDLVVPVPLSQARFRERGYNQAAALALPLALSRRIRYNSKTLTRVRETASQVGLTAQLRHENVKDAFLADCASAHGKRILVVDDVATTGATLDACAKALLAAGALRIYCLTLARTRVSDAVAKA